MNHHVPQAQDLEQAQAHHVDRCRHRGDRARDRWLRDRQLRFGSSSSANTAAAGQVIPFHRGQPSPATQVGQVPANFSPGTGTIITGTAASKAKAAALAAYPGGTVNRVVLLSDGEYNVHMIGVNWPHHVFVSTNFKVVGAE
jgi:hypothetical protein